MKGNFRSLAHVKNSGPIEKNEFQNDDCSYVPSSSSSFSNVPELSKYDALSYTPKPKYSPVYSNYSLPNSCIQFRCESCIDNSKKIEALTSEVKALKRIVSELTRQNQTTAISLYISGMDK